MIGQSRKHADPRALALTMVVAIVLAACGEGGESAETATTGGASETAAPGAAEATSPQPETCDELTEFSWGSPGSAPVPQAHQFIATELGYFVEHCLNVTVETGVPDPFAAVALGNLDIATGAPGALPRVHLEDPEIGVITIFGYLPHLNTAYGVLPDSPIESLSDLPEGGRVGVQGMSTTATENARAEFASIGIDPDTDIEWVVTPDPGTMARAISNGEIDILVYHTTSTQPPTHRSLGFELRELPRAEGFDRMGGSMFMASETAVAEQRADFVGYLRAYLKAWAFMQENPEAAADIVVTNFPELVEPGEERAAAVERTTEVIVGGWNRIQQVPEWARAEYGDLFGTVYPDSLEFTAEVSGIEFEDFESLYTNDLVEEAYEGLDLEAAREDAGTWVIGE